MADTVDAVLRVVVLRAEVDTPRPFVQVTWDSINAHTTVSDGDGLAEWDHTFDFPVEKENVGEFSFLEVQLMDDGVGHEEPYEIGSCMVGVSHLYRCEEFQRWYELEAAKERDSVPGRVLLRLLALGFGRDTEISASQAPFEVASVSGLVGLARAARRAIFAGQRYTKEKKFLPSDPRTGLELCGIPERFAGKYPALEPCAIFFMSEIAKTSPRKIQDRILVISDDAIYSVIPSGPVKRCIEIQALHSIVLSDTMIALIVPSQYDLVVRPNTEACFKLLAKTLRNLYQFHCLKTLPSTNCQESDSIYDYVQTRKPPGWDMNFIPPTTRRAWKRKIGEYADDLLERYYPPGLNQRQGVHTTQRRKLNFGKDKFKLSGSNRAITPF